jgi:hypothetical protein
MIFRTEFKDYCLQQSLGEWKWIDFKFKLIFNEHDFYTLNEINPIYSGQKGGLILGKLHSQGGIHLISPNFDNTEFTYAGEMEGWEYLSSPLKSEQHKNELLKINKKANAILDSNTTEFDIPHNCKVVDTRKSEINIVLLSIYSQFIVNRHSTKKFINEIIEIEQKNNW